jgi:hypothetical protein
MDKVGENARGAACKLLGSGSDTTGSIRIWVICVLA